MDDLKTYKSIDNINIIIPKDWSPTPLDCPICGFSFRDMSDISNFKSFGCCLDCNDTYRIPNKEKWATGWRPDNSEKNTSKQHNYIKSQESNND
tara:strand:- start:1584 stop:1865 length:282 start_codon:yes stop_codon:yes gene_type:complete